MNYRENYPNASKLINSLRHLDYNNLTAISDIIDNSIDANASQIWIKILPNKTKADSEVGTIIVSDNGRGMKMEILDEALKLGSDVEKNPACDLGLYGMGLVTASISMGKKLEVITKAVDGKCLKSVQDIALIEEKNEFVKILEDADPIAQKKFNDNVIEPQKKNPVSEKGSKETGLINAGTVVTIDEIDHCEWKTIKGLSEALILHIGEVYRRFITSGINRIYVQETEVKKIDPIYDFEPKILIEDEIKLEEGTIKIVIAELKDYGGAINKQKDINIRNQGFYVIRNNRQILAGESLGIFSKHNDFNTLRIELNYPGTLDSVLSSNFSKNRIALNQSLKDKVGRMCNPFLRQVRKNAKERQQSTTDVKEDFTEIEKYITQKSHLLKLPLVDVEVRGKRTENNELGKAKNGEGSPRLDIKKKKRISLESLRVNFRLKKLGEKGPVYEVDQERDIVVIYWNSDHPFYRIFIERNADKPDILNPISFLVYSLGSSELISKPDSDSQEILENIRWDVGRNLSVLLKD